MKLKQRYESIRDRIHEDYSLACKEIEEILCNPIEYVKNNTQVKKDAVSTIAAGTIFNPLYARIETTAGELTDFESIKSRILTTTLMYVIVGVGMEGRERLKKRFGVTKESSWLKKRAFDAGYIMGIVFPIRVGLYTAAGIQEVDKILLNAAFMTGIGTTLGVPMLSIIDGYKDLTGVDNTGVLPKAIMKKSKRFKRNLAIGYAAAGLAATITMYAISPNNTNQTKELPKPDKEHQLILEKPFEKPEFAGIEHVINHE